MGCSYWSAFIRSPSVYVTELSNGDKVAAIVNWRETNYHNFQFGLHDIGLSPLPNDTITVRDLYEKKDIADFDDLYNLNKIKVDKIQGHGIKVFKITTHREMEEKEYAQEEQI